MCFAVHWQHWKRKPSVLNHSPASLWAMPFIFLGKTDSKGETSIFPAFHVDKVESVSNACDCIFPAE